MKCANCNREISADSIFCSYCGASVGNEINHNPQNGMRMLTIERENKFFGSALVFQVFCDGVVIGSLRRGERKSFPINEKSHTVQCISVAPNMIWGMGDGYFSGSGGSTVSDVISIPPGPGSVSLFAKRGFASIRLEPY